ncbi:MAG: hypothetical protein ACM31C_18015, partial [Acidobacteriota bacterium]
MRALALIVATASIARADGRGPQLAALAPASDARQAIAIGPDGEIYQPDHTGAWVHRPGVAIAGKVASATRAGDSVVATTHDGPPFRLARDGWTVVQLGMHVKPLVGAGPRVLAAVGRDVFELDKPEPVKLPEAPAPVLALGASAGGAVVETERGLYELKGSAWKPLAKTPPRVAALLSDRLALVDRGLYDLRAHKTLAWPPGLHVVAAIATGADEAIAVAQKGAALELVTARAGKLTREPLPAEASGAVVGLAARPARRRRDRDRRRR